MFTVDHRQPGALRQALEAFQQYNLNLTRIDSRPSTQRPWHYMFFVECTGQLESDNGKGAVNALREWCLEVVELGSYPDQKPESL